MRRIASIDIGTNTIRLIIIEAGSNGHLREIASERAIVRLGEGIDVEKRLLEHRIQNALEVLQSFVRKCGEFGNIPVFAVATSAVREAGNREEFLSRVKQETGLDIDVIPWEEEAHLTLEGVLWKLSPEKQPVFTFDIGGGSTEFILSRGKEILGTVGTSLGVVRLTERFITQHPIDPTEYENLLDYLRQELEKVKSELPDEPVGQLVGTAGTVTTLAAIDRDIFPYDPLKIHGTLLKRDRIAEIQEDFKRKTLDERLAMGALERGREDLIVSGTALTLQTMEVFGCGDLLVSEYGLREGIIVRQLRKTINTDG